MDDLGDALNVNPDLIFMGGGNPASIPSVEASLMSHFGTLADDQFSLRKMLGIYQSPQGDEQFRRSLVDFFNQDCDWEVDESQIAICNGSQSAFFILFNMLAGETIEGRRRFIDLPLCPEYLGYADLGIEGDLFRSVKPRVEILAENRFKYFIDFDAFKPDQDTAAIALSRPTNPTGNVATAEEVTRLQQMASELDIPLILDGAYGAPFPNIIFSESGFELTDNTVLVLSLSKLGLPGVRTGIVVGPAKLMEHFSHANTLSALAAGNLGPALAQRLLDSGDLQHLSQKEVQPFYRDKMQFAVSYIDDRLKCVPYYLHSPEGAIFLWLWFENLPISSSELYRRLKSRGVLIVPGEEFFVGLEDREWPHRHQCIRLTYGLDAERLTAGIDILADEVLKAYQGQ